MIALGQWGSHYHDLPDAHVIKTEAMLRARRCVASAVEHRGVLLISGPTGSGKTFAAAQALADYDDLACVYTLFDGQANPTEMAREILYTATGCRHDGRREELRDQCVRLSRDPWILVIDEVQHLHRSCMFFLRYLHDRPEAPVTIILVGTEQAKDKVAARDSTLSSRTRNCDFQPIKLDVLLAAIPQYHPIYSKITADDIQRIHDVYAGGDLRRWADFAIAGIDECRRHGTDALDTATVGAALAELVPNLR